MLSVMPAEGTLRPGSFVEVLDPKPNRSKDVANAADTISYEILTNLGHRTVGSTSQTGYLLRK